MKEVLFGPRRHDRRPFFVRWFVVAVAAVLVVAAAVLAVRSLTGTAPGELRIRVDQAGYPVDARKLGFLMGGGREAGARYRITDANERVVFTGTAGRTLGPWNAAYPAVYPLELSVPRAGVYRVALEEHPDVVSPPFRVVPRAQLYAPLAGRVTAFFQAQRDGPDVVPGPLQRKPSHPRDTEATVYAPPAFTNGDRVSGELSRTGGPVDVSGGWFDAGDYLKFTGTTSYAVINLLLAARAGSVDPALAPEIAHGLAWLAKMWDDSAGVLYAQVGLGGGNDAWLGDHDVWRLPQADGGADATARFLADRPVFAANPGGGPVSPNLAGRFAAAFALAAQVHAKADPAQARTELDLAAAVYAHADVAPGDLVSTYPSQYYPEESWTDDLELAAAELGLAGRALDDTRAPEWLEQARTWAARSAGTGVLTLYDVSALAQLELATAVGSGPELAAVRSSLQDAAARAGRDPFRAAAELPDGANAQALGLIVTARLYAGVTGDRSFVELADEQAAWVLGANAWGMSFVVGAGQSFPRCLHHQVANLSGSLDGTGAILGGAVVNGPAPAGAFADLAVPDGARACTAGSLDGYTGHGIRFADAVAAWPSVEPSLDVTATGLLAFTLLGS